MSKEPQPKKKCKHAAKGWEFKFRGGIHGVNLSEIASTLSRKNPVAVVTLLPSTPTDKPKEGIIIIDSSLASRQAVIEGHYSIQTFLGDLSMLDYVETETFDAIFLRDIADAAPIMEKLSEYRQMELADKCEYVAAVNYPKI